LALRISVGPLSVNDRPYNEYHPTPGLPGLPNLPGIITGLRYEDHLRDAGLSVEPSVKNMGAGAANLRIEAVRRLLPKCWFNEETTEAGRDALGFYHERRDAERNVGLGPEHDWSSHAADAFGLMAISYEEPSRVANFRRKLEYPRIGIA
jgi:phage terminase large subunit